MRQARCRSSRLKESGVYGNIIVAAPHLHSAIARSNVFSRPGIEGSDEIANGMHR